MTDSVLAVPDEINEAALIVRRSYAALQAINVLLAAAGGAVQLDCESLHCLLAPIEHQLFSAVDAMAPHTEMEASPS